jgi:DNA-binding LytR/AlgR family response regulator
MESPATESTPIPRLVVLLKAARGYHVVDVRTILFAQAEERFCCMHFTDGTKKPVFHTLTELEGMLRCGERMGDLLFLRVHKSHIVAFHHATSVETDRSITLFNGTHLPIGRQYWTQVLTHGMSVRAPPNVVHEA